MSIDFEVANSERKLLALTTTVVPVERAAPRRIRYGLIALAGVALAAVAALVLTIRRRG